MEQDSIVSARYLEAEAALLACLVEPVELDLDELLEEEDLDALLH